MKVINFDEIFEAVTQLKNGKLKIRDTLIEKYEKLLKNPDFEQNHYSKTAKCFWKIGHNSTRLLKSIVFLIDIMKTYFTLI